MGRAHRLHAFDAAHLGEKGALGRCDGRICQHRLLIHVVEHHLQCLRCFWRVQRSRFRCLGEIGETAPRMGACEPLVRHTARFHDARDVHPALEGEGWVLSDERQLSVLRSGAVVVERAIKIRDALRLQERLCQKAVVRPAAAGVFRETDVLFVQVGFAVER